MTTVNSSKRRSVTSGFFVSDLSAAASARCYLRSLSATWEQVPPPSLSCCPSATCVCCDPGLSTQIFEAKDGQSSFARNIVLGETVDKFVLARLSESVL